MSGAEACGAGHSPLNAAHILIVCNVLTRLLGFATAEKRQFVFASLVYKENNIMALVIQYLDSCDTLNL